MKKIIFLAIAMLVSSIILSSSVVDTEKIEWLIDFDAAIELAKHEGKPVMIDFWATWCEPCKQMDLDVWPEAVVIVQSKKFVCIAMDVDRYRAIASRYRVNVIPTLVFADPWGNEINRRVGYISAANLLPLMMAFPADFKGINRWMALLEEDSKSLEGLAGVGGFYQQLGILDLSNSYFEKALKTKEVKTNLEAKENIMLGMGLNFLKMRKFKDARKLFEKCMKEFPNGTGCDKALLGMVIAHLGLGSMADAEKTYARLQSRFPDSPATLEAARNIQALKKLKK